MDLGRRLRGGEERLSGEALRPAGLAGQGDTTLPTGDTGDLSVDQSTQDISLELLGNERLLLAQVTDALKRIDDGTYGRCTVCGREISRERLQAVPYATLCVEDARKAEAGNVPASGPSAGPGDDVA
jgi:RNA polymerase-binding protein DksA